jgi:hypothetical protein
MDENLLKPGYLLKPGQKNPSSVQDELTNLGGDREGQEITSVSVKLNLLQNGLDFILRGLDELYEFDDYSEFERYICPISHPQKNHKYGVLHLFSGFLLLLKERLSRHKLELIYIGKPEKIQKGLKEENGRNLNTIKYEEAISLLESELQVTFSEPQKKVIEKIRRYRNCFEHYETYIENLSDFNKDINDFIKLIDKFLIDELKVDITSTQLHTNAETIIKFRSIKSIYERINVERERELTLLGKQKCKKFHRNRKNILGKLEKEAYENKQPFYDSFTICDKCREDTLIIDGEFTGVCSNEKCKSYIPLKHCDKCGAITTGYWWLEKWCNDCDEEMRMYVERDD